jgi:hypothetical protein
MIVGRQDKNIDKYTMILMYQKPGGEVWADTLA